MRRAILALLVGVAACSSGADAEAPRLTVKINGELAASAGYAFPPASDDDLAFVDGWDVRYERVLVTVDAPALADDPDLAPTDQSRTGGPVARATGPWAVDLVRPGVATAFTPADAPTSLVDIGITGGTDGTAATTQAIARFFGLADGSAFDTTRRYAFGYDVVAASAAAHATNLDAAGAADYQAMQAAGASVLYVGTATFKGTSCTSSDATYDFAALPKVVHFRFAFQTPTRYRNCQNTDLKGKAFEGEEAQRGVQLGSGNTLAQMTLHLDHAFWNTVSHDGAELYFDQMAAAAAPDGTLTLADLAALDFTSFKDRSGKSLPWRSCLAAKPVKTGVRAFDAGSVPVDRTAAAGAALRNYADLVAYLQSTQGHLNADGLCAVERQYPSPR